MERSVESRPASPGSHMSQAPSNVASAAAAAAAAANGARCRFSIDYILSASATKQLQRQQQQQQPRENPLLQKTTSDQMNLMNHQLAHLPAMAPSVPQPDHHLQELYHLAMQQQQMKLASQLPQQSPHPNFLYFMCMLLQQQHQQQQQQQQQQQLLLQQQLAQQQQIQTNIDQQAAARRPVDSARSPIDSLATLVRLTGAQEALGGKQQLSSGQTSLGKQSGHLRHSGSGHSAAIKRHPFPADGQTNPEASTIIPAALRQQSSASIGALFNVGGSVAAEPLELMAQDRMTPPSKRQRTSELKQPGSVASAAAAIGGAARSKSSPLTGTGGSIPSGPSMSGTINRKANTPLNSTHKSTSAEQKSRNTLNLMSSAAQALKSSTGTAINTTPLAKPAPAAAAPAAATAPESLPAWVFCTRYSDRPSSGPRTRRAKSRDKKVKDPAKASADEKRPRTAFTSEQLEKLRQEFNANSYLDEKRRKDLAERLCLNENQIKIWFQNKRAKMKKQTNTPNPLRNLLVAGGLYNHSTATSDCSESYANGNDHDIDIDDDDDDENDNSDNSVRVRP